MLYPVVMAAGIGVCNGFGTVHGAGGPEAGAFVLVILWLATTLTVLLLATPPRRARATPK